MTSNNFEDIKHFNVYSDEHYNCDRLYIFLEENNEAVNRIFNIDEVEFEKEIKPVIEIFAVSRLCKKSSTYNMTVLSYMSDVDRRADDLANLNMPYPFNKESAELDARIVDYDDALEILNNFRDCKCQWFKSNRRAILKVKLAILKILRTNNDDYVSFWATKNELKDLNIELNTKELINFKITRDGEDSYIYSLYEFSEDEITSQPLITSNVSYEQLIDILLNIESEMNKSYRYIDFTSKNEACFY